MLHLTRSCLPPSPAPLRLATTLRAAAADHDNQTTLLPADHYSSPFHRLELQDLWDGLGRLRMRQHVNPLRIEFQTVTGPLDWAAEFKDPSRPLVLDLGCGPGRFLLLMHHAQPQDYKDCNFLGVEIREQLVGRANEWAERLGFKGKVVYVHANATVSLASMLATYPGPVQLVCVQFPDPHFKRKHWKRRMLQPEAVEDIVRLLPPGGKLFLQTDVEVVAVALRDVVEQHAFHAFTLAPQHTPSAVFMTEPRQPSVGSSSGGCPSDEEAEEGEGSGFQSQWALGGWLADNPLGVPTEREHMVTQRGLPVYRMLLVKR
ncbi:putative methyltransferase-domain-containing protein [Haematococcus lacustris]